MTPETRKATRDIPNAASLLRNTWGAEGDTPVVDEPSCSSLNTGAQP